MEVVDADIQRVFSRPYMLMFRAVKQELSARVEVFSDELHDRQRTQLTGMTEFGRRPDGLLEIRRVWFVKYNRPVYYQPKEFHDILRAAKRVIIPTREQPPFMKELRSLFERLQVKDVMTLPICGHCIRQDRLTVLNRENAVRLTDTTVACISCAQAELRADIKSHGIQLSPAMIQQLERQLSRIKSVPQIMEMLSPDFDPTMQPDLTLFDRISVEPGLVTTGIDDLPIPESIKSLLREEGYDRLLPIQQSVIEAGLFEGKSLLVVASTSSGKTLIAELAGVPRALRGEKMIYLSPLVALTNEKYELWRRRYRRIGLKTGIRVGMSRLDVGDEGRPIVDTDVSKADIVCATYEALDVMLRSGDTAPLGTIGTVIIDEIQNLNDPERGPELDGLLARLRIHAPAAQIIGLSATVGAPRQLARRLKMQLVQFEGRPVPLERHLVFARSDEEKRQIVSRLVRSEFKNVSSHGNRGQSIVFTYSRRRAHALADWLRENHVSATVYHGGLPYRRRRSIELAFAKQRFACVVTTAALGAGVDLPASQVIFDSLTMGSDWLSNAEFEQMMGRAGRLGKHDRGLVYLIVQPDRKYHVGQELTEDEIALRLLNGVVESVEPAADAETCAEQTLATICSTGLTDVRDIAKAYDLMISPTVSLVDALKILVKHHMIRVTQDGVYPTELGRATSISYFSPSQGVEVLRLTESMDVIDIAVMLEPFENVYLSSRLQAEVDTAFRTHMPTRLFSGVFHDMSELSRGQNGAARLSPWVYDILARWAIQFFNCGCSLYPACDHAKIRLGRWLVERRQEGYNPSGIAERLNKEFELWAYPGDIYSWLDSLIHTLRGVQRIAGVAGKVDLGAAIEEQIVKIETPLAAQAKTASSDSPNLQATGD